MIPVFRPAAGDCLQQATVTLLVKRQTSASGLPARSKKIGGKWSYFLKNDTAAVADVRDRLDAIFWDKCCYCEKIIAKDIEHFRPKTLYPSHMFRWDNLLRACKDCNFEKLDKDPLDAAGNRVLLDPTLDDPKDYLSWDLDTGEPVYSTVPAREARAKATVDTCDLDNQKFCEQRRSRAGELLYCLCRADEEAPVREDTRSRLEDITHPRQPWLAVVRQIVLEPEYQGLIAAAEAKLPFLIPRFNALRRTHP